MNYLHVVEILNRMEARVVAAKLITYTKEYQECYNHLGDSSGE